MTIKTRSAFIYGHTIDDNNGFINFTEDGITELAASIEVGSYTLTEFVDKVAQAMNEVGGQEYTVTLDRSTRRLTIDCATSITLLVTTGTQVSLSAFPLMGFTANQTGTSLEGDSASGSIYLPQAPLYDFVDFDDIQESVESVRNESSSGSAIEVVNFGQRNFMECNIRYATDIVNQGFLDNNPNGVADLRAFMVYITRIAPIEFVPDRNNVAFTPCLLERTSRSRQGTGFLLRELYPEGLANYFETGNLVFRRL